MANLKIERERLSPFMSLLLLSINLSRILQGPVPVKRYCGESVLLQRYGDFSYKDEQFIDFPSLTKLRPAGYLSRSNKLRGSDL